MANLKWDGDDFRNSNDSSGATADLISHSGRLQQGYQHGSLTRGLVAYYPMDAGLGSTLEDKTELANDGTINGSSWTSDSKVGDNSLRFNGSSDYVEVPDHESLTPDSITVSVWVKANNLSTLNGIVDKRGDHSPGYMIASDNTEGYWRWRVYDSDGRTSLTTSTKWNTGEWVHLVGVYDNSAGESRFYVNSVLEKSASTGLVHSSQKLRIGWNNYNNEYWDGEIDEVRIYDRTLSTPEIKMLFSISNPSTVSPGDTLH